MQIKQRGSTLIEVMVAVLIVSIGLLGMASLQLKSMALNLTASQRLQATNFAYEIADSIYLNSRQAAAGQYELALADNSPQHATAATIADIDLRRWLTVAAAQLPEGDLIITTPAAIVGMPVITSAQQYTISVCWSDKNAPPAAPAALCGTRNSEFSFTVSSRINN